MKNWESTTLLAYRLEADTQADRLMQEIIEQHGLERLNSLFALLAYNNSFEHTELPESLKEFVRQSSTLPAWYDAAKIQQGERVFAEYGMEICVILLCKSLPECYLCWRGAKVLYETGRLMEQRGDLSRITRRIAETLQFMVNVMAKGGTMPDGNGIVSAQKIRLIHAAIRTFIRQRSWDTALNGEPINQEDLALTLTTFSSSVLQGLEMLGIPLTSTDREAYMHCWRVIGYCMGINDIFLTDDYDASLALHEAILAHQAGSSPENRALAKSCLDFVKHIIPDAKWRGIAPLAMRFFLGKHYAAMLGIKPSWRLWDAVRFNLLFFVLKILGLGEHHSHVLRVLISSFSNSLIQALTLSFNHYKNVQFSIPPSLKGAWGLENE
jgi:ER-bound oxygenase mpaB/B'/Rubber oxygenase, catalytic domain